MQTTLRTTRTAALRARQGPWYRDAGIPDEYVDWEGFAGAYVCRLFGCKKYGKALRDIRVFKLHIKSQGHHVCSRQSSPLTPDDLAINNS